MKITAADFERVVGDVVKKRMMIANLREPDMESAAYRDKKLNEKYKRINDPQKPTEGQLLGGKKPTYTEEGPIDTGELAPDGSRLMIKGMPPEINPEEHKKKRRTERIYKKSTDPQAQGAEKDWVKKTGPQLPKLLETIRPKPQDLLKILQYLPALTGGGLGQMASSRSLREHLKPGTKGLRDYDKLGGGRGIPEDDWLKLIRSAPKV